MDENDRIRPAPFAPGDRVDVYCDYDGSWSTAFEVVGAAGPADYRLRRLSDGSVLPAPLPGDRLRPSP